MAIREISQLKKLDYTKQLAFAYLTCERLYPNYVYFSHNFKFGNDKVLKGAINFISDSLFDNAIDKNTTQRLLKDVDKIIPYPEKFTTVLASSALDACTVVIETLNFLLDKQSSRLEDISTLATDTIDMYIQERDGIDYNSENFEIKIYKDPLMQNELAVQKGIISYLMRVDKIEPSDIDTLFSLQNKNKKSNIGL